jgi:hypothetical protein
MPVKIVTVPARADGGKQGIDDYISGGGRLEDLQVNPFEGGWVPPADWPSLGEEVFQGPAGEIVKLLRPHTESSDVALLALFLAAYGSMIGRGSHFVVEGDRHYCKNWVVLVGESAQARKGTAQGRVESVLEDIDRDWCYKCRAGGLSSGEGLIHSVRDRKMKTKKEKSGGEVEEVIDGGVDDKRLFITEPEFASPLILMQREGNVLSTVLRMAWDDVPMRTLTKQSPDTATGSHITVASHTNQEELLKHLTSQKLGGGVGNRFMYLLVRKSKSLPHGGGESPLPEELKEKIRKAVAFGKNHRHITLSEEATELWELVYDDLCSPVAGLFGVVTSRAEAQVRRLATTYAALECSQEVNLEHLMAGLALWEYSKQSSYILFRDRMGDEIADDILWALEDAGDEGMSRTELYNHFSRNVPAARIRAILLELEKHGYVRWEKVETDGPGRPQVRWFAC